MTLPVLDSSVFCSLVCVQDITKTILSLLARHSALERQPFYLPGLIFASVNAVHAQVSSLLRIVCHKLMARTRLIQTMSLAAAVAVVDTVFVLRADHSFTEPAGSRT